MGLSNLRMNGVKWGIGFHDRVTIVLNVFKNMIQFKPKRNARLTEGTKVKWQ